MEDTFNAIVNLLDPEEWILSQSISEDYARLVLKIDASRLNDFIVILRENFDVSSVDISAEDITQVYQDTESEIAGYEAEQSRLLELYEEASLSDMITINTRLSEIEQDLNRIKNDLAKRDTDILFSTVNIFIRQENVFEGHPFGEEVSNTLASGWQALVHFFQGVILLIVVLIPWLILIVPLSTLGYYVYLKKIKPKRKTSLNVEKS